MNTRATYFIRNSDGYGIVKYGKGEIDRGEMNTRSRYIRSVSMVGCTRIFLKDIRNQNFTYILINSYSNLINNHKICIIV